MICARFPESLQEIESGLTLGVLCHPSLCQPDGALRALQSMTRPSEIFDGNEGIWMLLMPVHAKLLHRTCRAVALHILLSHAVLLLTTGTCDNSHTVHFENCDKSVFNVRQFASDNANRFQSHLAPPDCTDHV